MVRRRFAVGVIGICSRMTAACLLACVSLLGAVEPVYQVNPISPKLAEEYQLDASFYKKCTLVQGILIATSDKVPDVAHGEAAYQFDQVMTCLKPDIAQRIRDKKVLCTLVGHSEMVSDMPQFPSSATGKELDFYNWRNRGFLTEKNGRPTFLFSEEDVMEYEGGMQIESILIHEFGHVIDGAGFSKELKERLVSAYKNAQEKGLYNDGYAAQKFRRVTSVTPVSLLDALEKSFPDQQREFLKKCLDGGDILVNGKPAAADVTVTKEDKVLIVFGGEKQCYAGLNKAEYWAESVQDWVDTNRTMDHDHNHLHTRDQLKQYDPVMYQLCQDVFVESPWRFVSPRTRAGKEHLQGYNPSASPKVVDLPHIDQAAQDYYDTYWKDYWKRLHQKYGELSGDK